MQSRGQSQLDVLVKKYISPHLLYASHFWSQHVSYLGDIDDVISSKLSEFLSNRFLEWLEVMSVTEAPFHAPLATVNSSKVRPLESHSVIPLLIFLQIARISSEVAFIALTSERLRSPFAQPPPREMRWIGPKRHLRTHASRLQLHP